MQIITASLAKWLVSMVVWWTVERKATFYALHFVVLRGGCHFVLILGMLFVAFFVIVFRFLIVDVFTFAFVVIVFRFLIRWCLDFRICSYVCCIPGYCEDRSIQCRRRQTDVQYWKPNLEFAGRISGYRRRASSSSGEGRVGCRPYNMRPFPGWQVRREGDAQCWDSPQPLWWRRLIWWRE